MSNIVPFNFEGNNVRIISEGEIHWFNVNDVCNILGYVNPRKAVIDHIDIDDVTKRDTLTGGGIQQVNYVNESGLYALIFGSTKESAKQFKKWVTSEVLPSIRKTGSYGIPKTLPEALRLAADLAEKIEHQDKIIEEAQPAIGFYDAVGDSTSLTSVGDAAKSLGFGRNHFFKWLRTKEFLMKDYNTPYQKWIEARYFQVKYQSYVDEFGEIKHRPVTFITGKGLQYLQKQLD